MTMGLASPTSTEQADSLGPRLDLMVTSWGRSPSSLGKLGPCSKGLPLTAGSLSAHHRSPPDLPSPDSVLTSSTASRYLRGRTQISVGLSDRGLPLAQWTHKLNRHRVTERDCHVSSAWTCGLQSFSLMRKQFGERNVLSLVDKGTGADWEPSLWGQTGWVSQPRRRLCWR